MYLDRVKNQLIELKLIRQDELVGCTRDEVMAIEQQLGISLPRAYQEFLLFRPTCGESIELNHFLFLSFAGSAWE